MVSNGRPCIFIAVVIVTLNVFILYRPTSASIPSRAFKKKQTNERCENRRRKRSHSVIRIIDLLTSILVCENDLIHCVDVIQR